MDGKLKLEQREASYVKTEKLMLEGVSNASVIAKELNCSPITASRYVKVIQKRWISLENNNFDSVRAGLIQKSCSMEKGAWDLYHNSNNDSVRLGAINSILEIHKHQAWLIGMTKLMNQQ